MTFKWYHVYNLDTFQDSELVSKTVTLNTDDFGKVDVLLVQGNETSLVIDGTMLTIDKPDFNPFLWDDYAVYLDEENEIWVGFLDED